MSEENKVGPLEDFITEPELCGIFGINKAALAVLRHNEGLPWCKINQRSRLYYEPLVRDWLLNRQKLPTPTTQSEPKPSQSDSE